MFILLYMTAHTQTVKQAKFSNLWESETVILQCFIWHCALNYPETQSLVSLMNLTLTITLLYLQSCFISPNNFTLCQTIFFSLRIKVILRSVKEAWWFKVCIYGLEQISSLLHVFFVVLRVHSRRNYSNVCCGDILVTKQFITLV